MKILFANIWCLNPRLTWAVSRLRLQQADIIVMAELPDHKIDPVIRLLPEYAYHQAIAPSPVGGLMVFSKFPIDNFQELNQGPFHGRPQGLMTIRWQTSFKLLAVHTSAPWTRAKYLKRNQQINALADLAGSLTRPCILAGDFNASHLRREMVNLKTAAHLQECRQGRLTQASWPCAAGFWCLDHFYYSAEFKLNTFKRLGFIGSDHYPIAAEFQLT